MNALANDQVKRLRRLLVDIPEITFGRYVGETEPTLDRAESAFHARYPSEPRLANELIAREQMQAAPPHILLTNYAMLEYLLLRPDDSSLFDGETGTQWRFVVLDEAHVYNGAQGTEVAMLLRRLRDRVVKSETGRLQCFATSATLGSGRRDYPALLRFANDLFGERFEFDDADGNRQDIVEASRRRLVQSEATHELPRDAFRLLHEAFRDGASASALYDIARSGAPDSQPAGDIEPTAYLHDLLASESHVIRLQSVLEEGSIELRDAADDLFAGPSAEENLAVLIDLCVAARPRPGDAPLVPAAVSPLPPLPRERIRLPAS